MAPLSSKVEHSLLEVGDDAESLPRASSSQPPPPPSAKPHPHPPEPLASASGTEAGPRPVPAVEVGAGEGAGRHDGLRGARLLMLRVLLLTAIALYLLRRVLPLLLLLTAAAAAWSLRRAGYWRRRGVPGPAPAPLVGNLWPLLRLRVGPGDFVGDIYRSAPDSPYVGFFILDKPCLVLRDPALIKRVLVRDFHAFAARHAAACPAVDPAGATNLFIARGRCWQLTRRALSPCFTAARLRALFPAMQRRTAALADFIQASSAAPGRPLKAKDAVARGVTDLVGECLFGVEAHALRLGDAAAMRAHGRRIFGFSPRRALEILSVFFVPALVRPLGVEFFHRGSSAYLERVFKELLRARRQGDGEGEGPRRGDALDDLLALPGRVRAALAKDGDDARGDDATRAATSDEHLVGQAMVFFTAGFETTASTISVALFELARSPRAQGRLRAELAAARARHGGLSYDALNDAPYLNMVISGAGAAPVPVAAVRGPHVLGGVPAGRGADAGGGHARVRARDGAAPRRAPLPAGARLRARALGRRRRRRPAPLHALRRGPAHLHRHAVRAAGHQADAGAAASALRGAALRADADPPQGQPLRPLPQVLRRHSAAVPQPLHRGQQRHGRPPPGGVTCTQRPRFIKQRTNTSGINYFKTIARRFRDKSSIVYIL